jgi:hypothetical protein
VKTAGSVRAGTSTTGTRTARRPRADRAGRQEILDEYEEHLPLTVRQIFYRLVGAYGYDKTEDAYKRLCDHLVKRSARGDDPVLGAPRRRITRNLWTPWFDDVEDFWDESSRRRERFVSTGRPASAVRIELWCEAAGMVPQLAKRRRPSTPSRLLERRVREPAAVRRSSKRCCRSNVPTVLLHVGDFDPSGESIYEAMTEDA